MTLQKLTSKGCNNFQLFNLQKMTRNYYTPVTYVGNYLIKRHSKRHIIIKINVEMLTNKGIHHNCTRKQNLVKLKLQNMRQKSKCLEAA